MTGERQGYEEGGSSVCVEGRGLRLVLLRATESKVREGDASEQARESDRDRETACACVVVLAVVCPLLLVLFVVIAYAGVPCVSS